MEWKKINCLEKLKTNLYEKDKIFSIFYLLVKTKAVPEESDQRYLCLINIKYKLLDIMKVPHYLEICKHCIASVMHGP
jgi:hypothetical protein